MRVQRQTGDDKGRHYLFEITRKSWPEGGNGFSSHDKPPPSRCTTGGRLSAALAEAGFSAASLHTFITTDVEAGAIAKTNG